VQAYIVPCICLHWPDGGCFTAETCGPDVCVCACVCVCMYVCMYACMHAYVCIRMYVIDIS